MKQANTIVADALVASFADTSPDSIQSESDKEFQDIERLLQNYSTIANAELAVRDSAYKSYKASVKLGATEAQQKKLLALAKKYDGIVKNGRFGLRKRQVPIDLGKSMNRK